MSTFEITTNNTLKQVQNANYVTIPRLTTAQRDALTGVLVGSKIWNTTTNQEETWNGTTWLPSHLILNQGTLAGRGSTSGTGTLQQITIGSGLVMTGTTLSVNTSGGVGTSPERLAQLQESFNDYLGHGDTSIGFIGGGIGFFATGMSDVGTPVLNPTNAVGVYVISEWGNNTWFGMIYYQYYERSIVLGNLTDKVNYFILKRRMRLVSFDNNRSFHYGVMTYDFLASATDVPETGVFFRWQTNGTSVINFQAHVRNSGISTIVTPSSQPSNWADWFVLEIQIGASGIRFFVNDSPVTGFITTNIPTFFYGGFYGLYGWTQSEGNIVEVDWDYARPNV